MAFIEKKKRRWGDRRDGVWVRDLPGMNTIMSHIYPYRTQSEAFLQQEIDITELLKYIEKKNAEHPDYKTTLFHCVVTALARMVNERPKMNRFIRAGRTYERDEISLGFVVKRQFSDTAEESLMFLVPKAEDTLDSISKHIVGNVKEVRARKDSAGIDEIMDVLAKLPRLLLMFIVRVVRWLDYWGKNPKFLTDGDPNYASIFISNLGSIKCPSVYHHLSEYGTCSCFVTIGTMHKTQVVKEDGSVEIRDVVDIGATVDERIADGFYFARSFKLVQHICSHPELLDQPLTEESGFDYK